MDKKSLYINRVIQHDSKYSINLEDKSGFNINIRNLSKDTLISKINNMKSTLTMDKKVALRVEPNTTVELINASKSDIKVNIRIYNHASKVVTTLDGNN